MRPMRPITANIKNKDFNLLIYPLIDILNKNKIHNIDSNYRIWFNDRKITQYNSHGVFPFNPMNDIDNYLNDSSRIVWGIVSQTPDDKQLHIGNVSLQYINLIDRSAEASCIIGEIDYWNKGVMTGALHALVLHGFQSLGLNRIWAGTAKVNIGMVKVFKKLGFAIEGECKQAMFLNGRYESVISFGLLRSMWEIQPQPVKNKQGSEIVKEFPNLSDKGNDLMAKAFPKELINKIIKDNDTTNPIDKIEKIRAENNRNWMDLLRLAHKYTPEEVQPILKNIIKQDRQITIELEKMINKE